MKICSLSLQTCTFFVTRKYPLRGYILGREHLGPQGSYLRHMEQLLLVTFCDSPAGIGASLWTDGHMDKRTEAQREGRTDVEVEIVI